MMAAELVPQTSHLKAKFFIARKFQQGLKKTRETSRNSWERIVIQRSGRKYFKEKILEISKRSSDEYKTR